ncbi:MAG: carbamoyltransferase HypF [Hydrogenobaculum sp.]
MSFDKKRFRLLIKGTVQGVGFRPFVYNLATSLGAKGFVLNNADGVTIEIENVDIDKFIYLLKAKKPLLSEIEDITIKTLDWFGFEDFKIEESEAFGDKTPSVPPDMGICEDCLKEFNNPSDRRYKYPFINCTNCGPRYSIVLDIPYDRKNTTMNIFEMCEDCKKEYEDKTNRRFHAEAISCPNCGPIYWYEKDGNIYKENIFELMAKDLKDSKIIALKGLGGFHLICNALDEKAVRTLRERKKRSSKPFAVMFKSLEEALKYLEPTEDEIKALTSIQKPIVLIKRKSPYFEEACKGLSSVGAFLAYTGIHLRLFDFIDFPIIATSGNISYTPICKDNDEAKSKLKDIADGFFMHNRDIKRPVDDSVIKLIDDDVSIIRLARSYAPKPIYINTHAKAISLGMGAFLKSTISIFKNNTIILSPHIGDLESIDTIEHYKNTLEDFLRFYDVKPDIVVCDMHPNFFSSIYAKSIFSNVISLQHHKAHILSVIAENNIPIDQEILGIAWDGTGYGEDGTIWGGEFFVGDAYNLKRAFYIKPYKLIGNEKAIKDPRRIVLSFLFELLKEKAYKHPLIEKLHFEEKELKTLYKMWENDINTTKTSSIGRLFDMVAYLMGLTDVIDYEAKGAMMVEDRYIDSKEYYDFNISNNEIIISFEDILGEKKIDKMASKFINTLFEIITSVVKLLKAKNIVVSGGVFYNRPLMRKLKAIDGINLFYNKKIPTGDGGISVGQAFYGGILC